MYTLKLPFLASNLKFPYLEYLEWMLGGFACVHYLKAIANTMMAEDGDNSGAKRWVAIGFLPASIGAFLGCFVSAS